MFERFNTEPCFLEKICPHKIECALNNWELIDASNIIEASRDEEKPKDANKYLIDVCVKSNKDADRFK